MTRTSENRLDSLLDRQSRAWHAGARPSIEELVAGSTHHGDRESLLDIIYNEIVAREDRGEKPTADEYVRRYPQLRVDLELHFEVHTAMDDAALAETPRLDCGITLPDLAAVGELPDPPDYRLIQLLGRGGMGIVYKAVHRRLRRVVALKMFEAGRIPTAREIVRFRTEAEAIARLQHPNIVQIFEIGEHGGLPFLALELADDGTLAHRLQQLPYSPQPAAELIETLARAVEHAHGQGIVHRDLKPANILFAGGGIPKITDFGLAKILLDDGADSPRDATRSGEAIGTPRYMAPEQAAGRHDLIGPGTDVYALGTLLYECLTGQVPFVSSSVVDTVEKIRNDEPASPRHLQPAIPRDLATICLHCLQKNPDRRYASAGALADDLRQYLKGEPIAARPTPAWEHAWKWCRRRPTRAALIAVGLSSILAGIIAAGVLDHVEQERIANEREVVETLMKRAQEALYLGDDIAAESLFRQAWIKVQGEPALRDYRTGVAGWLDHSHQAVNHQTWKRRIPPRDSDDLRDEALVQSLLLDPRVSQPLKAARRAIAAAFALTLPNDPAWRPEREQLMLLEADLILLESGAGQALAFLDVAKEFRSRISHNHRARYLDLIGREDEAVAERTHALQFPPAVQAERFLLGAELLRRKDYTGANRELEAVLDAAPEHFTARLFLAIGALHLDRPGEAKVGLTACIAQRPRFAWNYYYRSQVLQKLGDLEAAKRDSEREANLASRPPGN